MMKKEEKKELTRIVDLIKEKSNEYSYDELESYAISLVDSSSVDFSKNSYMFLMAILYYYKD